MIVWFKYCNLLNDCSSLYVSFIHKFIGQDEIKTPMLANPKFDFFLNKFIVILSKKRSSMIVWFKYCNLLNDCFSLYVSFIHKFIGQDEIKTPMLANPKFDLFYGYFNVFGRIFIQYKRDIFLSFVYHNNRILYIFFNFYLGYNSLFTTDKM